MESQSTTATVGEPVKQNVASAYSRPLAPDEERLLTHISRFGSDGYPVEKIAGRWIWRYCSLSAPVVYKTRRECTAAFEAFHGMLIAIKGANAQRKALSL